MAKADAEVAARDLNSAFGNQQHERAEISDIECGLQAHMHMQSIAYRLGTMECTPQFLY